MQEVKDALLRMVRSYRMVGEILDAYVKVGLESNTLFSAQGEIAEAVYQLLGEHVEEFDQSVTHLVLNVPTQFLTDERRAEMLYAEWKKNHFLQPSPNTMSRDDLKKFVKKNGGYLFNSPEGG